MNERNEELELYKLVTKDVSEFGWVNDTEFNVWLYHFELSDFIKDVIKIFDGCMCDVPLQAAITKDYVVIDLAGMLFDEDIEIERVFPKDEYKH
jgi:hypothetical protein